MGTKNNPGDFDCYEAAEPDEPMFVLLARDVLASDLVYEWARRRELMASIGSIPDMPREAAKIAEARACADAMRQWHGLRTQSEPDWINANEHEGRELRFDDRMPFAVVEYADSDEDDPTRVYMSRETWKSAQRGSIILPKPPTEYLGQDDSL